MKKLSVLFIALVLLTGCTDNIPANTSERMYNLGVQLLEIADDYLDVNTDASTAARLADEKRDEIRSQLDNSKRETGSQTLSGTKYSNDAMISSRATTLSNRLLMRSLASGTEITDSDVLECRNSLAEALGKKAR